MIGAMGDSGGVPVECTCISNFVPLKVTFQVMAMLTTTTSTALTPQQALNYSFL